MGGAYRIAIVPLMAGAVFVLGCGVPIAPEYVAATSTAQAIEQRQNTDARLAGQGGPDIRSAADISGASALAATPLPTREASVPATDATEPTPVAESTPVSASPTPAPTTPPAPVTSESFTQEFVNLLNSLRAGRGLSTLTVNGTLSSASNTYAAYMGSANFFGHNGLDGSTPRSRLTAAGYRGSYKGEAICAGQTTPQSALNTLLASPPHAAILLEPTAVEIGVGYAFQAGSTYSHYWVVVTGIP